MRLVVAGVAALVLLPVNAHAATVADWQMNEGKHARVMHDRAGNHDGRIGRHVYPGGGVFRFIGRKTRETYDPKRVVLVPESNALDPQDAVYTVQVRFRADRQFDPNIVQKGQTGQVGGFWKIVLNKGEHPRCMFRDETGLTRATGMQDLNVADSRWTTLRCTSGRTTTRMTVWHRGRKRTAVNDHVGALGTIDNAQPLMIGGKRWCEMTAHVGCDYFKGLIDYVKVWKS